MEEGKNLGLFDDNPADSNTSGQQNSTVSGQNLEGKTDNPVDSGSAPENTNGTESHPNSQDLAVASQSQETPLNQSEPVDGGDQGGVQSVQKESEQPASAHKEATNSDAPYGAADSSTNLGTDFFEGESKTEENTSIYPVGDTAAPSKLSRSALVIRAIVIIAIVGFAVWYLGLAGRVDKDNISSVADVNIVVDTNKQEGIVTIIGEDELGNINQNAQNGQNLANPMATSSVKIKAFYRKTGDTDCSRVYALERETEKKYDSDLINTIRGLLAPLSEAEKASGFIADIPVGTTLGFIKVNNNVAVINFSDKLNAVSGACAISAVKSQINQTAKQFPYVKEVIICINANCLPDQILQP
ncbi:MAG: GerMN domain-containing protein [Patescibacteria group bacterium]